ncbi:MAG: hypothetical protein B6I20_02685 [Bacteroidetes bacterium 4572_117]|nr:MAG: hypothetical protein B6I20_02685 [Bacteroidetes bacterium 4572_117]
MVAALDTNVAVGFLRGIKDIEKKVLNFDAIYLPVIVCGELLFGAVNATKKEENLIKTRKFINNCKILSINYLISEQYANIRADLKSIGKPIPENDIWIAAVCSINNIPLFSHDKHFKNINKSFLKLV